MRIECRGIFCRVFWGKDYYDVLREKFDLLEEFLRSKYEDIRIKLMVDIGELFDWVVVEWVGIGFSVKNCMIIMFEYGFYVYLVEMIMNIFFEFDVLIEDMCGFCIKCLDVCLMGVFVNLGQLNVQCCIFFLIQMKGFLFDEFWIKIGNCLYGCDMC